MTQTTTTKAAAKPEPADRGSAAELAEDIRDSAKAGHHAASEALRKFRKTVDDAIPEAVQPLRKSLVDAALELADKLITVQYELNRSIVHAADRVLSKSDEAAE